VVLHLVPIVKLMVLALVVPLLQLVLPVLVLPMMVLHLETPHKPFVMLLADFVLLLSLVRSTWTVTTCLLEIQLLIVNYLDLACNA